MHARSPAAARLPLLPQPQPETPLQAVPVHQGAEEDGGAGVSPLAQGWDASHCLVKQWGVDVELLLCTHVPDILAGQDPQQPMAVVVAGSFGVRNKAFEPYSN
eukprot:1160933-Pelagomonas_calceolata.AAC.1